MRRAVEDHVYEQQTSTPLKVTVSIGMTDLGPDDSFASALKRADEALYKAKSMGRNCVVAAD